MEVLEMDVLLGAKLGRKDVDQHLEVVGALGKVLGQVAHNSVDVARWGVVCERGRVNKIFPPPIIASLRGSLARFRRQILVVDKLLKGHDRVEVRHKAGNGGGG